MPFAHYPNVPRPVDAHEVAPRGGRGAVPCTPGRERLEAAVCEAVFRYQLQQPLVDQPRVPRYYLALQGHDPDEALLRRLRELTPWVQPLSQCRVTARDGVLDRATGAWRGDCAGGAPDLGSWGGRGRGRGLLHHPPPRRWPPLPRRAA